MSSKQSGFTMLELLLVVTVISTVTAVFFGIYRYTSSSINTMSMFSKVYTITSIIEDQTKNNIKTSLDKSSIVSAKQFPSSLTYDSALGTATDSDGNIVNFNILNSTILSMVPSLNHVRQGYFVSVDLQPQMSCIGFLDQVMPHYKGIILNNALIKSKTLGNSYNNECINSQSNFLYLFNY